MNDNEANDVMDFFSRNDIELFGFTPINNVQFPVPSEFSPKELLAEARSVICFGVLIPKGILHANYSREL